jgi:fructose-bisphosphate aldolase class 1
MNTKKILTFVAIAAGGYLAYKYYMKKKGTTSFVGNEDAFQSPFTGNEDAFQSPFTGNEGSSFYATTPKTSGAGFANMTGVIAIDNSGASKKAIKSVVEANLGRRKNF